MCVYFICFIWLYFRKIKKALVDDEIFFFRRIVGIKCKRINKIGILLFIIINEIIDLGNEC